MEERRSNINFTEDSTKPKKEKINIFKIGKLWCFKHFFEDREIYRELSNYYNQEKYRFGVGTVGERNKVMKYLGKRGFEPVLIEDPSYYTVKIDKSKKYASILKNSIDMNEKGKERLFIMKNLASVEDALQSGAEKIKL